MRAFLDPHWRSREFGFDRRRMPPISRSSSSDLSRKALPGPRSRNDLLPDPQKAAAAAALNKSLRPPARASSSREGWTTAAQAKRELWKASVKDWLRQHDRGADWELPKADEKVLFEWFEAIDIDKSGSVDAEEIKALLTANHSDFPAARIDALWGIVGKQPHQELALHDFVQLMHRGGAAALFEVEPDVDDGGAESTWEPYHDSHGKSQRSPVLAPQTVGDKFADGETSYGATLAEARAAGDLAVLSYRRQRVLADLRDPTKRGPFASHESFFRKYASGALKAYKQQWAHNAEKESDGEHLELSDADARLAAEGQYMQQHVLALEDEGGPLDGDSSGKGPRGSGSMSLPQIDSATANDSLLAKSHQARWMASSAQVTHLVGGKNPDRESRSIRLGHLTKPSSPAVPRVPTWSPEKGMRASVSLPTI